MQRFLLVRRGLTGVSNAFSATALMTLQQELEPHVKVAEWESISNDGEGVEPTYL